MDAIVVGCGVSNLSVAVRLREAGLGTATSSVVPAALRYPYKA